MKIIQPSFNIMEQAPGIDGIYKQIELAGRTCYKSEDRITETSAKAFVERMIASKHTAMLEHGTVYLAFPLCDDEGELINSEFCKYAGHPYSKEGEVYISNGQEYVAITTNYRVLVENGWLEDLQYLCEPTEHHDKRVTVHFVCDRAIANEFVRHRVFSFAQESTRYCNYSKDKFGNELTFIAPSWFKEEVSHEKDGLEDANSQIFVESCEVAEQNYFDMIKFGEAKPQGARAILPLSLKTELIMTGFVSDWKHFFDLRALGTTGAPHPDASKLAIPLYNEFKKRNLL